MPPNSDHDTGVLRSLYDKIRHVGQLITAADRMPRGFDATEEFRQTSREIHILRQTLSDEFRQAHPVLCNWLSASCFQGSWSSLADHLEPVVQGKLTATTLPQYGDYSRTKSTLWKEPGMPSTPQLPSLVKFELDCCTPELKFSHVRWIRPAYVTPL